MTLQLITIFLASLLLVSLIGPRRLAEGAAILPLATPPGLVVFIIAGGLYRRRGGG